MLGLNTTISGDENLFRGMARTSAALPGSNYLGVVRSCALVETRAKTYHLAGHTLKAHTRRLQSSVKMDVRQNATRAVGRVGSPVMYAAIHEHGGIIRPKNCKYLHFFVGGKEIFARQVTMPKKEWLLKSVQDVRPQIETIFGREVQIAIG